jgi:hypothetical protein
MWRKASLAAEVTGSAPFACETWLNVRMAKKTVVQEMLVDDLDGSPGDKTVMFAWEGTPYEIELSRKNYVAFEKAVRPYVKAARKVRGGNTTRRRPSSRAGGRGGGAAAGKRDLGAIRAWAAENGYAVSERGRIASSVIEAYESAQQG